MIASESSVDPFEAVREELDKIKEIVSEIEGLLLIDEDGMTILSLMQNENEEESWAGIASQINSMGEGLVDDLNLGNYDQFMVKTNEYYFIIQKCTREILLICKATLKAKLALLFMQLKRINRVVQKNLG